MQVLVELADLQDQEVGDGTTSVVIIASELMKVGVTACTGTGFLLSSHLCAPQRANELVKNKIHPTNVMSGYRLALKESIRYIKSNLLVPGSAIDRDLLLAAAKVRVLASFLLCREPLLHFPPSTAL